MGSPVSGTGWRRPATRDTPSPKRGRGAFVTAIGNKLVHIFLPLLFLAVAFVALYSLADWFLVAPGLVPLDEEVANFWLPFFLGATLMGFLIAPRLRVLKRIRKTDIPALCALIAVAVLVAPTLFAQSYIATASGAITHVKSADMIPSAPRTKYYAADSVCIDRQNPVVRRENTIDGQHNENLRFKLYVLVPVCRTSGRPVWVGLTYTHSVASSDDDEVKDAEYHDFLEQSQKDLGAFDPAIIRYFEVLGRTADRRSYEKALQNERVPEHALAIILIPHKDNFEDRNGQNLPWVFYSFAIAAGAFLLVLLIAPLDREKLAEARKPRRERTDAEPSFLFAFLVPHRDSYGLPILIDINLAVFLAMVFSGLGVMSFQTDDLIAWGGNYGPDVHGLGVYRLISSQFLHGGIEHIMGNMYGLMIGGLFLSPVIRKAGLIVCYLVCGLGGAIASLVVHPSTVSFGASGAIMGLWGILLVLALLRDKRIGAARWLIVVNCLIFAGLTFAQGFAVPGIDNAAHVGGFATGVVIGLPMLLFSWGAKAEPESIPEA